MKEILNKLYTWIFYLVVEVAFFWHDKISEPIDNRIVSLWHRLFGLPKLSEREMAERYVALARCTDYGYLLGLENVFMGMIFMAISFILFPDFYISAEDEDKAKRYVVLAQTGWDNIVENEVVAVS